VVAHLRDGRSHHAWLPGKLPSEPSSRLGAALRRQRGADDRLVRVHVGDGRDADARRLDDVDGVDADARTDVARRRGVVPRHVGRDDGGDDAAVPDPMLWRYRQAVRRTGETSWDG
jgi:hypothetical protein